MVVADTDDIRPLLEQAKLMENSSSIPYHTLFYLALHTGMRRGEILALRWSDIDIDMATISVNRSLQRLSDGTTIVREPKTPKARRNISMTPSLAIQLRDYQSSQKAIKAINGKITQQDDLIFCDLEGNPLNPNTITPAFHKIAKRAGLNLRMHDLRHTHASLMLKQGVHPKIVSERLGHATTAFTLDTYSHVVPGLQEAAAKKFDDFINPVREATL